MPVETIRPRRLYEQIAEQIGQLVRSSEIKPGDKLPSESTLARQLGVSRPSVREAMIALETAGIVEVKNGNGTYVRALPKGDLKVHWAKETDPGPLEQFEARRVVECELAALAAKRAKPAEIDALEAIVDRIARKVEAGRNVDSDHLDFHVAAAALAGVPMLATLVESLFRMRNSAMWLTIREKVSDGDSLKKGVAFRRAFVACLRAGDSRGAQAAMRQHFARVGKRYFG